MSRTIKWLIIFFMLLALPFISATATIGNSYNIVTSCENFDCALTNVTVFAPNSSVLVNNQSMTNHLSYASYSITPDTFGIYNYLIFDGGNYTNGSFTATSTGVELSTGTSIVYIGLIALFVIIFGGISFAISFLPKSNKKDEEGRIMSINWLKYLRSPLYFFLWILFIAITFLSSNLAYAYLGEQLFADLLFNLFRVAFGITPIIIILWVVWFFIKFFQDKQFQNMLNRGLFPQTGRF